VRVSRASEPRVGVSRTARGSEPGRIYRVRVSRAWE